MLKKQSIAVPFLFKPLVIACVIALVSGCGGGGGGGGHKGAANVVDSGSDAGVDETNNSTSGINGDLTGTLYFMDPAYIVGKVGVDYLKFDLQTGVATKVPALSPWDVYNDQNELKGYDIDVGNKQIVAVYQNYLGLGDYRFGVKTYNKDFEELTEMYFDKCGRFTKSFRVSPDGKYLSMSWVDCDGRTEYLSVFDRLGKELWSEEHSYQLGVNDTILNHVWLPDSSGILINQYNAIALIDFNRNAQRTLISDFNGSEWGLGDQLSLSPDGKKILISIALGSSVAEEDYHIYTIGIDGSGLKQLTNGVDGESSAIWSSDGDTVFVLSGVSLQDFPKMCTQKLYVVPSDADAADLPNDVVDAVGVARPIRNNRGEFLCHVSRVRGDWGF